MIALHIITLNSQSSIFNLFAELATLTLCQFATEALLHEMMEAVAQRLKGDLVYHLSDEGELKEELCILLADATLTHIEEGGVIELTYRRAVRTLHVVGVNLEHRLSVHTCCLCGAKILVDLL